MTIILPGKTNKVTTMTIKRTEVKTSKEISTTTITCQ
jgi:hypothetical protein